MARLLSVVASVLFGLGVVVGVVPVSARGTSCGAAFWPSSDARVQDYANAMVADSLRLPLQDGGGVEAACTDLLSVVRVPAFALIAVSAGVGIASAVVRRTGR